MIPVDRVRAWRPRVSGVAEVLHAEWRDHAYPAHTHDTWTLLLVDDGVIGYELDRHGHAAYRAGVTLLPPHVAHDGHPVSARGFRKRVVYLDTDVLGEGLVGAAVDGPLIEDAGLREQISRLDHALVGGDDLEAESRLAVVADRLTWHLTGRRPARSLPSAALVARQAREILDSDPTSTLSVVAVADALGVSAAHLVRSFTRSYGIPPHRYLVGRRLDIARHRLLAGEDAARVATATGFYDQAHLTRPSNGYWPQLRRGTSEVAVPRPSCRRWAFSWIDPVKNVQVFRRTPVDDDAVLEDPLSPPFASKIAVVVRDDLESWQRLNVTAFLVSGITAAHPALVGEPYEDADGQEYLRLLGVPILVFEGSADNLRAARSRALQRGLALAIYTRDMFSTGHDAANRGVVATVPGADLDLVGLALHGPRNAVDKTLKGTHLHP